MLTEKIFSLYEENHFQMFRRFPVAIIKGKGSKVYDTEGKMYIDALAGIAVNSVGHCHPRVVKAIQEQAEKLIHVSNLYYNVPQSTLAQLLVQISGFDRVFFNNSGLEANEGAIKIARKWGKEKGKTGKIYGFTNCFHGRSIATLTMGKDVYKKDFGPMPEGFDMLSYNNPATLDTITKDDIAVFVEAVQGEGGVYPASMEFMEKLSKVCKEKEVLLVVDEVQTGLGRTGKLFGYQHYGLQPDMITLAKSLGGGVPIGAVMAKEFLADVIKPGDHGTTFGGNPLACAAAVASLQTILEDDLTNEAKEKGEYFIEKLQGFANECDSITEIRGKGLMIGIQFNMNCREIAIKMMEKGVLVGCSANTVIRIMPPLNISYSELDAVFEVLVESIQELEPMQWAIQ